MLSLVRLQHLSFGGPWGNLWDLSFDFVTDCFLNVSSRINLFKLAELSDVIEFTELTEPVLAGKVTEMRLDNV